MTTMPWPAPGDSEWCWLNPPASVRYASGALHVRTGARTDFWQETHYGFRRDDGHFLFARVCGDFDAEIELGIAPNGKYDQAGLMARVDADNWIKTSVEYEPEGASHLGAVVTQFGSSDWSMAPVAEYPLQQAFRMERRGPDFALFARLEDATWTRTRLTRLRAAEGKDILLGPYACSPTGDGCDLVIRSWLFLAR